MITFKEDIIRTAEAIFRRLRSDPASPWAGDVADKLESLFEKGKFIRGSLLVLSHDIFGGIHRDDALQCAAALELFETSILIHDDVIDRDETRRGMPSIHTQYSKNDVHHGYSMAICAADVGLFHVYELLNSVSHNKTEIISCFTSYMTRCVYGEMEDVEMSTQNEIPTEDEVLRCYKNKTSTYSFQLPLVAGAVLAYTHGKTIETLESLGENLGLLFQLKDDELGVFGDEKITGKPVGNDIREGKKTLYYVYSVPELRTYFGKKKISETQIRDVQRILVESGVKNKVSDMIFLYKNTSKEMIDTLPVSIKFRNELKSFVDFFANREK